MTRDPREGAEAPDEARAQGARVDQARAQGAGVDQARAQGAGVDQVRAQGAGLGGLPGPRRAKPPSHRPAWLVLLSSLTLVYGGVLLVSSLDALRDPRAATHVPATRAMTPAEEEITHELALVGTRVAAAHARSIRGNAAASLPVALLMLFAAASTVSRDRRGRQVALAAAWTGIVYQLGTLALTLPIVRDYAAQAAPLLARLVAMQGDGPDANATPEVVAKVVMAFPVFTAAVAIAGSLVLIGYFGGRRGRVLYGLERPGP